MSNLVPKVDEHFLEFCHSFTLNTGMYVAPFTKLWFTCDIIIGYIHATRIGHYAIDDHYLTMVAMQHVIYPRKAQRVKLIYFDTSCTKTIKVARTQRAIIRTITKAIEQGAYLYALCCLLH